MLILTLKRIFAFMTALVTLITGAPATDTDGCKKQDSFKVTSYVVSDHVQSETAFRSEDFDIITDVILFGCATFDEQGNVILEKQELETALNGLRRAIGDRDIHITLNLLGPWGETDSDIWEEQMDTQTDAHNKGFFSGRLGDNIIAVLDEYGFDGVHFDYEYPISLKAHFWYNIFIIALGKKLGDKYTLGIASNEWNLYLSTSALKEIDTIEMMMYDFYDDEGRHSTFETATELSKEISQFGIPLEKVNFGLPFYARPTDGSTYWYGYDGYYDKLDADGYYYDENIDKTFWFNDDEVIYNKTKWAVNKGYGGVMIWHYSCDIPSGNEVSLLRNVGKAIEDANS